MLLIRLKIMFVTSRALSINSCNPFQCCKCVANVQKSTVTILVMNIHMFVCVHCPLQCLCRCRRKISQLIEYLKLPNRNFKFITQCRQAGRQATGHIQPTAGSQWSVHSTAITFLDVWLSALSHSFVSTLSVSLSWYGIKCHLIAI